MKKLLLFLLPLVFAAMTFGIFLFLFSKNFSSTGALQVTANTKSKVYVDGKLLGETPLCKCEYPNTLPTGNYTIRIVADSGTVDPFEQKITVEKSVLTVVDRTFSGATTSEGSIISLKSLHGDRAIEVFINSFPDKAQVLLDKNVSGQTPLLLKNLTASDHDLTIEKNGYKVKTIHIHAVSGYRLLTTAFLAIDPNAVSASSEASPSAFAIPSISISPPALPTTTPSVTPKVTEKLSPSVTPAPGTILILDTPTGYLNVRENAGTGSKIVGKINPGDTFTPLDEQNGWYEIKLSDGTVGWISGAYAKKE